MADYNNKGLTSTEILALMVTLISAGICTCVPIGWITAMLGWSCALVWLLFWAVERKGG